MTKSNTKCINKLKELRNSKKLTQDYMAQALNISKPYYWQIENGNRRLSYMHAVKIAKIFDLKPDDIFYEYYN